MRIQILILGFNVLIIYCLSPNGDQHQLSSNTVHNRKLKKLCSLYQRAIFLRAQPSTAF